MDKEFVGPATPLSERDIKDEAKRLGCDPAVVHAVCDVEAAGHGFLPDKRPKILFESHAFHQLTGGRYDRSHPNLSTPTWDRSTYGPGGAHQYDRLEAAMQLNRNAALQSASWGMFQVMGENFHACGANDVETFVKSMVASEHAQLDAFGAFCMYHEINRDLATTPPRFAAFAYVYNGAGYAENGYDTKLAAAWRKWRAREQTAPNSAPHTEPDLFYSVLHMDSFGPAVSALQTLLMKTDSSIAVDEDFGPETLAAVVAFQKAHGLTPDGIVGPQTLAVLPKLS